ncbi:diacylglycerol kinase family protein [Aliikangiella maris]|uniref:Diacylglycerol kinase family protein n=2 Tax=Aliikangiella maris TaxID=3162458 RepID=A0ABV3MQR7_9GAMM
MVKYYLIGLVVTFYLGLIVDNLFLSSLLFWLSVSLAVVSFAYLTKAPQIFRKRENGIIPWYVRWLLTPFLAGATLYNWIARRYDSVPAIQKVDSALFLACRLFSKDIDELKSHGVSAILDITAEFNGLDWTAESNNLHYLNVAVLDHQYPSEEQTKTIINWLNDRMNSQQKVVIHCALGRGRSVWVMAAFLMHRHPEWDVQHALTHINKIRNTARLNRSQYKALEKFKNNGQLNITEKLCIIANPVSGGGKWQQHKSEVIERLSTRYQVEIKETEADISAEVLTREALQQAFDIIVAAGGDGTVAEVANMLVKANNPTPLAILPMGTANALAHLFLGATTKVAPLYSACDAILQKSCLPIDVAKCNDRIALLVIAIGKGYEMITNSDRSKKNDSGQFAYLSALWESLADNRSVDLVVTIDQEKLQVNAASFVVANAAPSTTILAQGAGKVKWQDGLLDITWFESSKDSNIQPFVSVSQLIIRALCGAKIGNDALVKHKTAKQITIQSSDVIKYVIDGETYQADVLNIETLPQKLTIIVNKQLAQLEDN